MKRTVKEFGAFGDGIHDDRAAIQAALDSGAAEVVIPMGIYCVSDTLRVGSDISIQADRNAKIVLKAATRRKRGDFLLSNADTEKGNKNIRISGGIWDGSNTAAAHAKPDIFEEDGYSGALLNFVNVEGLSLKNMVLANSVTYYVRMSHLHHFEIEDIELFSDHFGANQDGLHFGGDVKHGTVKNIRALSFGQPNDDLIALNADDSILRVENRDIARDDIEDIAFENLYAQSCHTIVRLLSVTAAIRNISIKNVFAGYRCYAINADGARYCRTPLFKEEEYPAGVGVIENVHIENFTCYPAFDVPGDWKGTRPVPETAFMLESNMKDFSVSGFRLLCPEEKKDSVAAVRAKNLRGCCVEADGEKHLMKEKSDVLEISRFERIRVDRVAEH